MHLHDNLSNRLLKTGPGFVIGLDEKYNPGDCQEEDERYYGS